MLVISGNSGNYISFGNLDEVLTLIQNLKKVVETDSRPYVYGWCSDKTPTEEFDNEYKFIKAMISNDLVMRARAG